MTTNNTAKTDTNGALKTTKFSQIEEEENVQEDEDMEETAAIVVPSDGGWAWVVMLSSFLCNVIMDGIVLTSGTINGALIDEFSVSDGYVALVNSLFSGFYLMSGPFVSALANRYGFRPVTIVGAFIATAAFAISSYATSIEFLFISYGVFGGIGFSMVYIPSVIIIGYYFEKWRALATGIAMCGSGVGTFLFPPLTNWVISKYSWREALLVQSVIVFSTAFYSLAYRPTTPTEITIVDKEDDENQVKANEQNLGTPHRKTLPEGRFAYSVPNSAHNTYMGHTHHHYPTAAEVFRGANIERKLSGITGKSTEMKNLRKSQPPTPNGDVQHSFNLNKELATVGELLENEEEENQNLITELNGVKPMIRQARRHTVSGRRPQDDNFLKNRKKGTHTPLSGSRPIMYRDDIFFSGSLAKIPQYTSQSSLGYHMSVTRIATKQEIMEEEEEDKSCKIVPAALRRTLSTMLDTTLLTSPSFMLLCISGFLTMMGFFIPFIFVGSRAKLVNLDESTTLFIVPAIGIANTVARIACGLLSSFEGISALHLNNIFITAGGLATMLSGIVINGATQYTFAALFGICIACFSALRSIIAVELMGIEKLTNAYGFLMLFQGLASAIGAPLAGLFFDLTGSYDVSFYFAGALITLSGVLCYPLRYVSAWEARREERRLKEMENNP